jgi:hypothetical protein
MSLLPLQWPCASCPLSLCLVFLAFLCLFVNAFLLWMFTLTQLTHYYSQLVPILSSPDVQPQHSNVVHIGSVRKKNPLSWSTVLVYFQLLTPLCILQPRSDFGITENEDEIGFFCGLIGKHALAQDEIVCVFFFSPAFAECVLINHLLSHSIIVLLCAVLHLHLLGLHV